MNWKKGLHRLFLVVTVLYFMGMACWMAWDMERAMTENVRHLGNFTAFCHEQNHSSHDHGNKACDEDDRKFLDAEKQAAANHIFIWVRTVRGWYLFPTWHVYLSLPFLFYGLCRAMIFISRWVHNGFRQAA